MESPNVPSTTPDTVAAPQAPETGSIDSPKEGLTAAEIKKFKIGETEYDETTLKTLIEKGNGADRKFQEVAAQRKEIEGFLKVLKDNPGKAVLNKALGHNPTSVIGGIIKAAIEDGYSMKDIKEYLSTQMYEWIQEENLDPRDRELKELRKQLEMTEAQKKAEVEAQQKEITDRMTEEAYKTFNDDIVGTLTESGLPRSTFTVKRMAYYLDQAFKIQQEYAGKGVKIPDPKAAQVVSFVKRDYENAFKELYSSADPEQLIKLIGEEGVNKIRKYDVERLRNGGTPQVKPATPVNPMAKPKAPAAPTGKVNFLKQREEEIRRMERES